MATSGTPDGQSGQRENAAPVVSKRASAPSVAKCGKERAKGFEPERFLRFSCDKVSTSDAGAVKGAVVPSPTPVGPAPSPANDSDNTIIAAWKDLSAARANGRFAALLEMIRDLPLSPTDRAEAVRKLLQEGA